MDITKLLNSLASHCPMPIISLLMLYSEQECKGVHRCSLAATRLERNARAHHSVVVVLETFLNPRRLVGN